MLEIFMSNPAVSLLKEDHTKVKRLFDEFEAAKGRPSKRKIVREALTELKVHAAIEEELFYPAVRKAIGKEIMNEADEEHHVAKLLVAELDSMDGSESHYDAKFMVLAENVRHHIKEEDICIYLNRTRENLKLRFAYLEPRLFFSQFGTSFASKKTASSPGSSAGATGALASASELLDAWCGRSLRVVALGPAVGAEP